jgi:Fe-S-cluster containining protein
MSEKSKYNFKCLEQKCTTKACHIRPQVTVTIGDLGRWTAQGYLMNILPGVSLKMPTSDDEGIFLEMARKPLDETPESTSCFFYNEKANGCEIRYSRPISCRTYPLEYNGEKFYLSSKECPGVGQGEVSKEALQESRNLAEQEYRERTETNASLPAIYSIIMTELIRQSTEAMKKRSEEEKKSAENMESTEEDKSPQSQEDDSP